MINSLRLTDAAIRFGGTLLNPDCEFDSVAIDSRNTAEGDLFVALIGERLDGHEFLADVADKASGLVVSKADTSLPLPQWVVEDTTVALGQLAQLQREAFSGKVIAVTGSTGKIDEKHYKECGGNQSSECRPTTHSERNEQRRDKRISKERLDIVGPNIEYR